MKYALYLSLAALLFVSTCFAQTITVYDENVYEYYNLAIGGGQSFTATQTGVINQIDVMSDSQITDATLYIYNGGIGSGIVGTIGDPVYTQGSINIIASGMNNEWGSVMLSTPFAVVAGSQYSFVLIKTEGGIGLRGGSPNGSIYPGGNFIYGYGGSEPSVDLFFRIWESAAAPTPTPLKAWPLAFLLIIPAGIWAGKRIF